MSQIQDTFPADFEQSLPDEQTVLSDEECLKERKWWVFLLSSVLTFIVGVMSVVVARGFVALCCRKDEDDYTQASSNLFGQGWVNLNAELTQPFERHGLTADKLDDLRDFSSAV